MAFDVNLTVLFVWDNPSQVNEEEGVRKERMVLVREVNKALLVP